MTISGAEAREHFTSMRRTALRLSRNSADADDVVQEALLRAMTYVRDGRQVENWRGYLNRVVRNVIADGYAKRARQGIHVDVDDLHGELSVAPNQYHSFRVHELEGAMAELPTQQADVLRLVAIDGLSYRDAADRLGVPVGTVMSRLHRGREALRIRLDDMVPAGEA